MKFASLLILVSTLLTGRDQRLIAQSAPAAPASPRDMWARVEKESPPFEFKILKDEQVPSDTDPGQRLRRIEVRFSSQVVAGASMDHTAVIFMPADAELLQKPERRGKVVIVGQRWNDTFMLYDYGDSIAARTGYPTMVLPNPGEFDGRDGEGRWITHTRTLTQETRDAANHNYFRLAVPYLRGIQVFAEILGEKNIRAIIGGHSKRATSAFTAAAIDPEHIAGVVYMGNESVWSRMSGETFRPVNPIFTQEYVKCPVLYLGATNEDGYEMFNINKIQAMMERPWTIEYIPNYRHASASEIQYVNWRMWIAHIFDDRPLSRIEELRWEETDRGTVFRAKVRSPNKIIQVKFWYVHCDDVPFWRDLVWYPTYKPTEKGDGEYEAFVDGLLPDAWFVEVKDTALGVPGYISSLPQDITHKPTKERVSRGWKSRLWNPKPPPTTAPAVEPSAPAAEYFPGERWNRPETPERLGWSSEKLTAAKEYADSVGTAAVFIVHHGRLVHEWGPTDRRFNVHSIRKSLLSALYGRHLRAGNIHATATLAQLGIEDKEPGLTPVERQATVSDLLRARSGVYHEAAYETAGMKAARPQRGSHAPGTFWYYNNWDFNVLGTIFREATNSTVGQQFQKDLAGPLQLEDFRPEDATEYLGPESIHPAYPFRLSARDMARIGLLFLRNGRWRDRQVIAADWIAESTRTCSIVRDAGGAVRGGYGYMWWTTHGGQHLEGVDLPEGTYSARGAGGHHILIVPALDLVIVHRVNTDGQNHPSVTRPQFGEIVKLILAAMPAGDPPSVTSMPSDERAWLPDALDRLVPELMVKHKVPGVSAVGIEHGRISWERQYGVCAAGEARPVDSQTVFEAASMSKPPFAYVALKLVERAQLDLDRPLVEYLDEPYLPDEPKHKLITARMVLTHTTGMPNWRKGGWKSGETFSLLADPGTRFTYSGEGFLYLQRVAEHITGVPLEPWMRQKLLDPLGLTLSSYVWQDRYDRLAAAGHDAEGRVKPDRPHYTDANSAFSLYCTPAEYAAFLIEVMRPDRSGAHSLSADSVRAMLTPTVRAEGHQPVVRSGVVQEGPPRRGLGWAVDPLASGHRVYHSGSNGTGFRCYAEFDPKRGSGLVLMTNAVGGQELWRAVLATHGQP